MGTFSTPEAFVFNDGGSQNNMLATAAMMNGGGFGGGAWNNPIWALAFLGILGNGGFGGWGNGGNNAQLSQIQDTLNTNQGNTLLMNAIQGNATSIKELASLIGCNHNAVQMAINGVQSAICGVGNQVGMTSAQVINAINNGNMSLANTLQSCCCDIKTTVNTQGYENRIANLQQSQLIQNGFAQVGYAQRDQTCTIENAIKGLGTQMANQFANLETRALQDKLQASRDENTALKNQLSNEHQTAIFGQQIAQAVAPIVQAQNAMAKEVDDIKCKLPESVTIPYSPVVGVPSCVAYNAALYGLGGGFPFAQQGNVFS